MKQGLAQRGEPSPIAHWLSTIARMEDLVMLEQTNII
jgi:hypothetical protein